MMMNLSSVNHTADDTRRDRFIRSMGLLQPADGIPKQAIEIARKHTWSADKHFNFPRDDYYHVIATACAYGYHELVKMLLEETSMEVNVNTWCYPVPLQYVTKKGMKRSFTSNGFLYETVFHMVNGGYASLENHWKVIDYLVEKGARYQHTYEGGEEHILSLAIQCNIQLFLTLLKVTTFHSEMDDRYDIFHQIMKAAIQSGKKEAVHILPKLGIYTPTNRDLYAAFRSNKVDITRAILDKQVNADSEILFEAMQSENYPMMELLVEHGADIEEAIQMSRKRCRDIQESRDPEDFDLSPDYLDLELETLVDQIDTVQEINLRKKLRSICV